MSILLDGKAHARHIREKLTAVVAEIAKDGIVPGLHVILVGEDPASQVYVRHKARMAERVGIRSIVTRLPAGTKAQQILDRIVRLNEDAATDGILVQLPVPGLATRSLLDAIAPEKDVDGFHPHNAGLLAQMRPCLVPATPLGIISLLDAHGINMEGRRAVVAGRSDIVGRPMASLLTHRNATVTVAHSRTTDLHDLLARADLAVIAIGRYHAIPASWFSPDAVVIDVGMHRGEDGRLGGDVNPQGLATRVAAYTPVPGGVGPMTIAMLLVNTTLAAMHRRDRPTSPLDGILPTLATPRSDLSEPGGA